MRGLMLVALLTLSGCGASPALIGASIGLLAGERKLGSSVLDYLTARETRPSDCSAGKPPPCVLQPITGVIALRHLDRDGGTARLPRVSAAPSDRSPCCRLAPMGEPFSWPYGDRPGGLPTGSPPSPPPLNPGSMPISD